MFIDESGADLTVTVSGEDYLAEASVDADANGLDDTVIVETDDGAIAFTDTDADGQADLMTRLDAYGEIVGQARFDQVHGDWVQIDPSDTGFGEFDQTRRDQQATGSGSMTMDTPAGQVEVGVPTHDTDADGVNDTVVVQDADGDTLVLTDTDHDGQADVATEITGEGQVSVSERSADGDWTVVERGHLDQDGRYRSDAMAADEEAVEESGWITSREQDVAEVRVDPQTGGWIRG